VLGHRTAKRSPSKMILEATSARCGWWVPMARTQNGFSIMLGLRMMGLIGRVMEGRLSSRDSQATVSRFFRSDVQAASRFNSRAILGI